MAEAQLLDSNTNASAGALGARASANATVCRVAAGFDGTPLTVSAEGPGAGAGAGVHAGHVGAYVGAHAGEAAAGPFAARAGVKFGAGVENGVPVAHLGPVSLPCSLM